MVIRPLVSAADQRDCIALQREIWGTSFDPVPASLLHVALHLGGVALGAFDTQGDLGGFVFGLTGIDEHGKTIHWSHMLAVRPHLREAGLGRRLKECQREQLAQRQIAEMYWTYDPSIAKNAHFNLNRLGAICRRYVPNLYGITTSPLHRGIPTDRLVAEWFLDSPRVVAAINGLVSQQDDAPAKIDLPRELDQKNESCTEQVQKLQFRVHKEFTDWFHRGYAAIAVQKTPAASAYLLAPWSEF